MSANSFDSYGRFVQTQYGKQPTFSSFLPGIAGPFGVPIWCNYNNRGQGICSFGSQDKDHAILEFTAAHTAYRQVATVGFRTFLKINGAFVEPFADGNGSIIVEPNALLLQWKGEGMAVEVTYFTLPNSPLGALCRKLTVKNCTDKPCVIELLDGLSALVPYGIHDTALKNETQLSKAWMQVEQVEDRVPVFRTRASIADSAKVSQVEGCNFSVGFVSDDVRQPILVQPELVFGWDTSLSMPQRFMTCSLNELLEQPQKISNIFPCSFISWQGMLKQNAPVDLYSYYGQADEISAVSAFVDCALSGDFFDRKLYEARALAEELSIPASCKTSNSIFDSYCKQNFIDNALRGGFPYQIRQDVPAVYIYSRKHGDPEREYNYFSLSREYFSQGNGNFRDICQNRRCDVLINPIVNEQNIRAFFELIQPDGYNPLVLKGTYYRLESIVSILALIPSKYHSDAKGFFADSFTLGALARQAIQWDITSMPTFIAEVLRYAENETETEFKEGYWCDHWSYLLDLVRSYMAIYPERTETLLFENLDYRWSAPYVCMLPQQARYVETQNGIRQYRSHTPIEPESTIKWVQNQGGEIIYSSLAEKLVLLCAIKFATLDLSGAAIEMEGGKPGWYDALNGMPGLLASSVADGCGLLQLLEFVIAQMRGFYREVFLHEEILSLMTSLQTLCKNKCSLIERWIARNNIRDNYRASVIDGFSGNGAAMVTMELADILDDFARQLRKNIEATIVQNNGIPPTYFWYEVTEFQRTEAGILPTELQRHDMPLFLEGPTRWLKVEHNKDKKNQLIALLKQSDLYDRTLRMYKVNASLHDVGYEVGRAKAFTAGWLENESIWLHMSYKYLLALLESGQYKVYFEELCTTAIPFLSMDTYRRSTLENVSFIESSAGIDNTAWGRGHVARLSGSTAEFISLWQGMFFGFAPFRVDEGELCLELAPAIPSYLVPDNGVIEAVFLGSVQVRYELQNLSELYPGTYSISSYTLYHKNGTVDIIENEHISAPYARMVREKKIMAITVNIIRKN